MKKLIRKIMSFKEIFKDKPKININYKKFNSNKINKLINPAKW